MQLAHIAQQRLIHQVSMEHSQLSLGHRLFVAEINVHNLTQINNSVSRTKH